MNNSQKFPRRVDSSSKYTANPISDYQRIAKAIEYLDSNLLHQPTLNELADCLALSPFHVQRLFSRWAGISPKRFLQVLTLQKAKDYLSKSNGPVLEVAEAVGLSSGSRIYDHFVKLEAVTPSEYKSAGRGLVIEYGLHETLFGNTFIAMTERGICQLSFIDNDPIELVISKLQANWRNASLRHNPEATASILNTVFGRQPTSTPLNLFVKGTNFQINVWRALLDIQNGEKTSYGALANRIGNPKASRAVGSAVGANPIALIIPCQRVIRATGGLGGYRWGLTRKKAMLALEDSANN